MTYPTRVLKLEMKAELSMLYLYDILLYLYIFFHFSGPNRTIPLLATSGVSFEAVPPDART